jgi:hypothetical protein
MAALVAGIHVSNAARSKKSWMAGIWMAGTSPAMTAMVQV